MGYFRLGDRVKRQQYPFTSYEYEVVEILDGGTGNERARVDWVPTDGGLRVRQTPEYHSHETEILARVLRLGSILANENSPNITHGMVTSIDLDANTAILQYPKEGDFQLERRSLLRIVTEMVFRGLGCRVMPPVPVAVDASARVIIGLDYAEGYGPPASCEEPSILELLHE